MSELARTTASIFAALAPLGALPAFLVYARVSPEKSEAPLYALLSAVAAFAILVLAALLADPFLDLIDVSPENFQFAAGAIMAPLAIRLLITGDSVAPPRGEHERSRTSWFLPIAFPMLAGPAAIAAALTYSARFDEPTAIGGAALAVQATALLLGAGPHISRWLRPVGVSALGRLSGAFLVLIAVELAIDGVRSV